MCNQGAEAATGFEPAMGGSFYYPSSACQADVFDHSTTPPPNDFRPVLIKIVKQKQG